MTGSDSGTMMRNSTVKSLAPSILADSSMLSGIAATDVRMMIML